MKIDCTQQTQYVTPPSSINRYVHVDYNSVGKTQDCRYVIYAIYVVYMFQISEQTKFSLSV